MGAEGGLASRHVKVSRIIIIEMVSFLFASGYRVSKKYGVRSTASTSSMYAAVRTSVRSTPYGYILLYSVHMDTSSNAHRRCPPRKRSGRNQVNDDCV